MSNELMLQEIQGTQEVCQALMNTPHYKRLGAEGIYAIVEKAKSIGVSPLDALNGGLYYVQGKVEMTAQLMNQMIRRAGHSVTKDKRSDATCCILHGKRADNGDTWVASFSIEEAKLAGIYRNQWLKYPQDMLFARALSRLARQLFPDLIKGCYVEGEIQQAIEADVVDSSPEIETITDDEFYELEEALGDNAELRGKIVEYMQAKWGIDSLARMPRALFAHALKRAHDAQGVDDAAE